SQRSREHQGDCHLARGGRGSGQEVQLRVHERHQAAQYAVSVRPRGEEDDAACCQVCRIQSSRPASVAERKLASVPAIIARNPSRARSCFRSGTSAPIPPIWIPTDPILANPHSANEAMVKETGSRLALSGPSCE